MGIVQDIAQELEKSYEALTRELSIEARKLLQDLKAENERLKKQLSQPAERTVDATGVVQQVQGLLNGYLALRDQVGKLQAELATRNEDIRRLQKMVTDLQKTDKQNDRNEVK